MTKLVVLGDHYINHEYFTNYNWENFEKGDKVYVENNPQIEEDVVYFFKLTHAVVYLLRRKPL